MLISRAKIAQKKRFGKFLSLLCREICKRNEVFPFLFHVYHEVELLWWLKTLMLWFCHLWPLTVSFVAFDGVICGL